MIIDWNSQGRGSQYFVGSFSNNISFRSIPPVQLSTEYINFLVGVTRQANFSLGNCRMAVWTTGVKRHIEFQVER